MVQEAVDRYPVDPAVIPMTVADFNALDENLAWRWVGFFQKIVHDNTVFFLCLEFYYFLHFFLSMHREYKK